LRRHSSFGLRISFVIWHSLFVISKVIRDSDFSRVTRRLDWFDQTGVGGVDEIR